MKQENCFESELIYTNYYKIHINYYLLCYELQLREACVQRLVGVAAALHQFVPSQQRVRTLYTHTVWQQVILAHLIQRMQNIILAVTYPKIFNLIETIFDLHLYITSENILIHAIYTLGTL